MTAATILIVDDEVQNRKLLEALLRPEGYLTLTAANGEEALASIARQAPDLILLDVMMPGMDGYQVAGRLKADPATSNIPIIMVTAQIDRGARLTGLDAGAEEFLTKPVDRAELWLRVRNLLRLKEYGDFLQDHGAILEQQVQSRTADLQRCQAAMDATADSIYLVDRSTMSFVRVNDTACRMHGRTRAELLALGPGEVLSTSRAELERTYDALIASGADAKPVQLPRRRNDGSTIWVEVRLHAHRSGDHWMIVTLERDVTELRVGAEALSESDRRFSDLLQNVELVSLMLDREARITYCNEYLLRLTGWRHEEVIGRNWFELFVSPENDEAKNDFTALLANEPEAWHRESEILTRPGGRRLIRWNNSVLRSGAGDVIGTASIGEDITEQKLADEKIRRLNRIYAVLSGINTLIVRVHDRQELFKEACRIAVEGGKFPFAWVGALDPVTLDVTPVAWAGKSSEELTKAKSSAREDVQAGKGAVGRAIRERRPVFNNDIARQGLGGPRLQEILRLGFRSQITLPLYEHQAIAGALTMYANEPDFFDEDELRLLTELAGDISFALENIARQQKLDKLARIRAVSGEINATIIRIHDREALLRETCRIAVEHGKFELVWIGTVDATKQQIQPVAWHGFSTEIAQRVTWTSSSIAGGTLGEAIRTAKPTVRNDIETEMTSGGMRAEALKRGYLSTVCMPLVVDGKVVVLISIFAAGKGFFDEDELTLLNEVAANVSFALQTIEKQKKLDYLSMYDALTGLANRALFLERVAQYIRGAAAGGHKLALCLIDLERFKNINDSLGQPAGDELLRQVAGWLTQTLGDVTLLARVGADHFAVVLPVIKEDGNVAHLLEKTLVAFLDHPFCLNEAVFRIAAKAGVTLFPEDGADSDALFRNAEAALKKAKSSGERYLFYAQKMTEAVAGKLTLENQLRQALDNGEFVLHYQPKVDLASGMLTGAEALIRWNDPRTGLVPPGQFIPILEETGLIYEVGRWALREALADYLRWRAAGLAAVRIAVNVSPLQLRNRDFITEIRQAIGIDPHAAAGLELEITESLIMADVKHSISTLQAIRDMGVRIAIDDFGTGFSSLSYLARLPVDTLKIDRSFVIDMTVSPEGLALVSTIVNLGHSLNLKVVAEGVETEEQSGLLRLLKCDEMQGYLFSKPVPREIFETRYLAPPAAGKTERTEIPAAT